MRRLRSIYGFHLLELVVTFSILGIVLAISIPSLPSALKGDQMKRESEKISSGLEGLSVRAAHERTDITVALFRNGYIATSGGAKPRRIARRELKAPVIIGSSTRHSLVFYRTGTATPASIEIRYGDRSCRIALSLRGRITRGC